MPGALRLPSPSDLGLATPRPVKAVSAALGLGRQRLALVVGNGMLGKQPVLASAARDTQAVAAALRAAGFVVMVREDLSAADLRASLAELRDRLQPGGIGFVYITALTAQVDGQNLWLPREAPLDAALPPAQLAQGLAQTGVPLAEVVNALLGTPESPRMLVLDAAYQHPALAALAQPGLGEQRLPPGMVALFSSALGVTQARPNATDLPATPPAEAAPATPQAASRFARALVEAIAKPRITGAEALRTTRRTLFDGSQGLVAPWLSGDNDSREELAESTLIDSLIPRTPEDFAREALKQVTGRGRNAAGEQTVAEVLQQSTPTPAPGSAAGAADAAGTETVGNGKAAPQSGLPSASSLVSTLGVAASAVGAVAGVTGAAAGVAVASTGQTVMAVQAVSAVAGAVGTLASVGSAAGSAAGSAMALASQLGSASAAAAPAVATTASTATAATTATTAATTAASTAAANAAAAATQAAATSAAAPTAAVAAGAGAPAAAVTAALPSLPSTLPAGTTLASGGTPAAAPTALGRGAAPGLHSAVRDAVSPALPPAPQAAQPARIATASRPVTPRVPATSPTDGRTARNDSGGERPVYVPRTNAYGYAEGDTFTYQVTDTWKGEVTGSYTTAIEEVLLDGQILANGAEVQMDAQGRVTRQRGLDGTVSTFEPSQGLWWSNPKRGESREVRFKESFQRADATKGQTEWKGSTSVGRPRKIDTPAGPFEALPVESSGWYHETLENGSRASGKWTRTVWYAPKLGHPVAIDIQDADALGKLLRRERVELMHAQTSRGTP